MPDPWDHQSPTIDLSKPGVTTSEQRDPVATVETPSTELVPVPPAPGPDDAELRQGDVDAWGRSERARELARTIYDPLYRYWFRAEWEGLEHVPTTGGALILSLIHI